MADRRALLKALVAAPFAAIDPPVRAATAGSGAAAYGQASQALTGFASPGTSDTNAMFGAFATTERRAALARLAKLVADTPPDRLDDALRTNGLDKLADDLVAAWYSGIVTNGNQQRVVLYTDAYMWSAMSFTKPMGVCGGVTGYWKDPPA
jgi:hypothetical protein